MVQKTANYASSVSFHMHLYARTQVSSQHRCIVTISS